MSTPASFRRWVHGYDLIGTESLAEFQDSLVANMQDRTPLGKAMKYMADVGTRTYTETESGWLDDNELSLRGLVKSWGPGIAVTGRSGSAPGAECAIATKMRLTQFSVQPEQDGLSKINNVSWDVAAGGTLYQEGKFLFDGVATAPLTSPYIASRVDLGAAHTTGYALVIMANGVNLDGGTAFRPQLYHSDTAGSGYTIVSGTAQNFTTAGPHSIIVDGTGNLKRYIALSWNWSGSAGSAKTANLMAAIALK